MTNEDGQEKEKDPAEAKKQAYKLAIFALIIGGLGFFMTRNMEGFSMDANIPKMFLYGIMEPIAGNIVEHLTALMQARLGRADLGLGIPLGSAIQILFLSVPLAPLISIVANWCHIHIARLFLPYDPIVNGISLVGSILVWIVCSDNRLGKRLPFFPTQ